jgi:pSer/pThr/pTyr-binding forkhead associated (FHA) protein
VKIRAQFVHLSGGREGAVDTIEAGEALIGRDRSACPVHADPDDDPSISRVHARVWFDGRHWQIKDEHSANGIRVRGEIVSHALLEHGTIVELSQSVALRFELGGAEPINLDNTAVVSAAVRTPSEEPPTDRTGEFVAEPTIYGGGGFEQEKFATPDTKRGRTRRSAAVRQELKMYRILVACLAGILLMVGGTWLAREAHLKQARIALLARSAAAVEAASEAVFSTRASGDWMNREETVVTVDDAGQEVVTKETVRYLPEDKKAERLSAIEELIAAAEAETAFSKKTGEEIFAQNLSQDPFEAHIQQLMGELTGTPTNMRVPGGFLAIVKSKVGEKLQSRHKGRWSARDAFCRLKGIRAELEETLTREVAALQRKRGETDRGARQGKIVKDLIFVAWVESQYKPTACSHAAARGMWQFIPSTGRRYGLGVEGTLDERCNWRKATVAAAGYFDFLLREFKGYPFLALAAYNAGENRVGKVLKNPKVPKHLANFYGFTAAGVLPDETRKYVPSIVASAFIGNNYDKALGAWNAAYPKRTIKPWDPCTGQESRPPPSVPCRNGPEGCPKRRLKRK